MKKETRIVLIVALAICSMITPVSCVVKNVQFDKNCSGYIKQAADANTVEIAFERITIAIDYAEHHGLTEGYTSVIYQTEGDNVGFWYRNLKACQSELGAAVNGSQLEKSNVLMKVRESLTDNGEHGTNLSLPHGISRYPYNTLFTIFGWISVIIWIIVFCIVGEDY